MQVNADRIEKGKRSSWVATRVFQPTIFSMDFQEECEAREEETQSYWRLMLVESSVIAPKTPKPPRMFE